MIQRRTFLAGLGAGFVLTLAAEAQQAKRVYRVGFLVPVAAASQFEPQVKAFGQGLRDLGYVEGQNIVIEWRWVEGGPAQLRELAAHLVRLQLDVIVTVSTPATLAAKQATTTIPIVMTNVADPVGSGLVASLARPRGNVTGLSSLAHGLVGKQMELLKEAIPHASRVAVLSNPDNRSHGSQLREAEAAAPALGLQLRLVEAREPAAFDGAFSTVAKERAGALFLFADVMFFRERARIVALAAKHRLPAMFVWREAAEAGGLIAYGSNPTEIIRRSAAYVDKILKGAKPADLPVEQPTKFELVINLRTAKALGLTIPPSLLLRADQVIE